MTRRRPPATVRVLAPRAEAGRISRRALLGGFAAIGTATLLGCSGSRTMATTAVPDGTLEDRLNVYSWGDYESPDNIRAFRSSHDITVQVDSFASNEEMIAKIGASRGTSGYDVLVPSGQFVPMMVANDLLSPLDHRLIPNIANLETAFVDQPWDPGNTHAVPKAWGTTGFAYDTTKVDGNPTSWRDFLDLAAGQASGSVSLLDDPWEVASIYFGSEGIDPNTTDPKALDAAEAYLTSRLAPHVRAFNSAPTQSVVQNELALLQMYNGDARLAFSESDDPDRWRFVYPTPTANLWVDTWAIARGAQHVDAAHAFINFMLDPETAIGEVDWNGYPTGITGQRDLAEEWELEMLDLIFPSDAVVSRLTPATLSDAQDRLTAILEHVQAKAG
ncbi:spermidine/putrescine ABC transporter substrate-binding protein [Mumia sp. zg.B17]|uniref:polyamine ABC transporter substrate-binding protein n=1 Tax=unclassified Mumia TaxID=2621872 RepID=UPI001C6E6155|nr:MULTISPECIES: spermidine/putrescine ABC transporter substrate-binding protein [unclassified Mumia]MBW9204381.1 spermidine/putrescine ABC transporter substrate-binding protein [Mumia sp. zg.B17]MDD9350170.1 spermidine/putrescine ABC transporter substrate-binding protein [Mumia sp.]